MPGPAAVSTAAAAAALETIDWPRELGAVLGSEEWEQLQAALQEQTPGGGPAVATLLQRAAMQLQAACRGTDVLAAEPAAAAEEPCCCCSSSSSCGASPHLVQAVQAACWEKLHTGSWHEVALTWRDAYSAACILAAAGANCWLLRDAPQHAQPGSHTPGAAGAAAPARVAAPAGAGAGAGAGAVQLAAVEAALRHLDMAAMMGGTLLRPAVDPLIAALQRRWQGLQAQLGLGRQAVDEQAPPAKRARAAAGADSEVIAAEGACGAAGAGAGAAVQEAGGDIRLPPGSLGPRGTLLPEEHVPSLEAFWGSYMRCEQPCVIKGAMQDWPALQRWADPEYLRSVAGPRTVPVEVGRHYLEEQWGQQLMTLSQFLDRHILPTHHSSGTASPVDVAAGGAAPAAAGCTPAEAAATGTSARAGPGEHAVGYLAQHPLFEQIPELGRDIREPAYCVLGEGEVQAVNAWYGPPGTTTPLHTDPHHNLLCQVVGRKYIRLYAPEHTPALHPLTSGLLTNNSSIDMEDEGAEHSYPDFVAAPFADLVLGAGDMLYIPPGWWHFLKSLTTSFSVSVWWR